MSQDTVAIVRRQLEAFDRRDRDAWLELRAPDAVVVPAAAWVEVDEVTGAEAVWDYYTATMAAFQDMSFADNHTAEEVGPGEVLVHHHAGVRGRASGADVELDLWVLVSLRNGKVVREQWFIGEEEARRATS